VFVNGSTSALSRGYFSYKGESFSVPPALPPVPYPLRWCPNHVISYGKCTTCVGIEGLRFVPKPPFKFYPTMHYDFPARALLDARAAGVEEAAAGGGGGGKKAVGGAAAPSPEMKKKKKGKGREKEGPQAVDEPPVDVHVLDPARGLYLAGRCFEHVSFIESEAASATGKFRGRPVGFFVDKNQDGWVLVHVLLDGNEARALPGLPLPEPFDRARELVHLTAAAAAANNVTHLRCVPVANVRGTFPLTVVSRDEPLPPPERKAGPVAMYYLRK